MPTHNSLTDYIIYCTSGAAAVGFGDKVLNLFPDPASVVTAAVLALVGATVGGGVKLAFDLIRKRMDL